MKQDTGSGMDDWSHGGLKLEELQQLELKVVQAEIREKIKYDYSNNPADINYKELKLYEAYFDVQSGRKILVFDILYTEDVQVIYEIGKADKILKKYLYSSWN